MAYQYVAYKETGEIVHGKLDAANEEAANELLDFAGYRVVSLRPFEQFLNLGQLTERWQRVKPPDMILFYRQLALLLESGIDIVTALELLQNQASSRPLKRVLGDVIFDLRGGSQLSAAMSKHPAVFSPIHSRSLMVGEQTGSLELMLRHIADHMEKDVNSAKSIRNALMYPIIATIVAIVVVGILITFVLPSFGNLYNSLGVEMPGITRMLMNLGQWFRSNGLYVVLGVITGIGTAAAYLRSESGKQWWHGMLLKLPLVGRVHHLNELARYCRNIALLFRAGLPLSEILPLVVQSSSNTVMARALVDVQQEMLKGEGLSKPLSKNELFLPLMVQMVRVGEETGRLDATLLSVTENYETEAQDKTRRLIGLIQPIVTLIIGAVVGFIALSLVTAMYSIYGQMG